jgi:Tfp pilus assembly protein FimV
MSGSRARSSKRLRARHPPAAPRVPDAERARAASLRQRNTTLLAENRRLRDQIAELKAELAIATANGAPRSERAATDTKPAQMPTGAHGPESGASAASTEAAAPGRGAVERIRPLPLHGKHQRVRSDCGRCVLRPED